jgi:hypothetical protein
LDGCVEFNSNCCHRDCRRIGRWENEQIKLKATYFNNIGVGSGEILALYFAIDLGGQAETLSRSIFQQQGA